MREIEYQSNGQPIAVNFEDLKEKLGYKTYKPRIGILGQALIKLAKEGNQRSIGWLKNQLDTYFRSQNKNKKGNKRTNGNQK